MQAQTREPTHAFDLARRGRRARRPAVVAFDTLQTLWSLDPIADLLDHAGLPDEALELFFDKVLRDAFALELGGAFRPIEEIARAALDATLFEVDHEPDDRLVERTIELMYELPVRADAAPAMRLLRQEGLRVVLLTNGSRHATASLVARSGLSELVETILTADDAGRYKPSREAYLHAARALDTVPSHVEVVTAHSWDVHGAIGAGLGAAWVRRHESAPNPLMHAPDWRADDLVTIAEILASLALHPDA